MVLFDEESANPVAYRAHVYGRRAAELTSEEGASLFGIAMGSDLALADEDVYMGSQSDGTWLVAAEGETHVFETFEEAQQEVDRARELLAAMDLLAGEEFSPLNPPTVEDPPWDIAYDQYLGPNSNQKGVKTLLFIYAKGGGLEI